MTLLLKLAAPTTMRMSFSPLIRRFSPPPLLLIPKTTRVIPASGRLLVLAAAAPAPAPAPPKKENGGGEDEEEKKLKEIAVKQMSETAVEETFKAFIGMGSWLMGLLQTPTTELGAWLTEKVLGLMAKLMKLVVPHLPRLFLPFIPTILVGASIIFTVFFYKTMKKEELPVQPSEKEAAEEQPMKNEERDNKGKVDTSTSVKNGKKVS